MAVLGRYYNKQGGVSNVMAQLAARASRSFDVSVVSHEFLDASDPGVNPVPSSMLERPRWLQVPTFALSARKAVRRGGFSLVHAHDPQAFEADLYTAHSCFKHYIRARRETASVLHRAASAFYPPHVSGLAMGRLAYGRTTGRIVTVSGSVRDELLANYDLDPTRVGVIHNGVDVERFRAADRYEARSSVSQEIHVDLRDRVVLVFVGYEFKRKRLATVIRALASADEADRLHLLVVGGADANDYEQLGKDLGVSSRITFMGHRSDVARILRAADVFAFPTQYEAASLAILEAAAAGLAIITTGIAMAKEVFTDGTDAILLPNVDDPAPMRKALDRLATDPAVLTALQDGASRLADRYTWDVAWRKYADIYAEILDEKVAHARAW